jgi:hypothetical protein
MDRTARASDARFEYRDLVIPLHLRLEGARYPTARELAAFHGYDGVVLHHLGVAARAGWFADEAADWDSLTAAGRFVTEADPGAGGPGEDTAAYKSVTIRLRRLAGRG